jgi:hypothetical protein
VTLQVPGNATPGIYLNTTSTMSSTIGSVAATSPAAQASLTVVGGLSLAISFVNDPVAPGGVVTLQVTITNGDNGNGATAIAFSDNLGAVVSGLATTGPLPANPCGSGSTLSGGSTLSLAGGNLAAGGTCTFSVNLLVPASAVPGNDPDTTSSITGTIGGTPVTGPPASDTLMIVPLAIAAIPTLSPLALLALGLLLGVGAWLLARGGE